MNSEHEYYSMLNGASIWLSLLIKAGIIVCLAYVAWIIFN